MTIHTSFFVSGTGIDHVPVCQHGTSFIRNVEKAAVTFLALFVFERCIGIFSGLPMIVIILGEMENNVFEAMKSLCIKEVDRTLGGRKVTVHAIRHESLGVIGMGRRFPGVESKLYFVAEGTKLGSGGTDHGVVRDTEKGKSDEKATDDP